MGQLNQLLLIFQFLVVGKNGDTRSLFFFVICHNLQLQN